MKNELKEWLSEYDIDVFATVTLKQAIRSDQGAWVRIGFDNIKHTGWILRDRISKAMRSGRNCPPFLVFYEGDGDLKRYHLHIATKKPSDMSLVDYSDTFRRIAKRLHWVYDQIDIFQFHAAEAKSVIGYSLKEGAGAFIPEASFLPVAI